MKLVRAFVRPDVESDVVLALEGAGYTALTKFHVFGRGKQRGIQVGPVSYDEIPKVMLAMVVEDDSAIKVKDIIMERARTGNMGDGKIFISPVEEAYTIRTGEQGL